MRGCFTTMRIRALTFPGRFVTARIRAPTMRGCFATARIRYLAMHGGIVTGTPSGELSTESTGWHLLLFALGLELAEFYPRTPLLSLLSPVGAQSDLQGIKVAGQGKVAELITKGGLKSDGHNLSIGLQSSPVGSAIQISK